MTKKVLLAIFLLASLIIGVNSYERKADDKLLQSDHELTYGYIIFKRYGTSPWGE